MKHPDYFLNMSIGNLEWLYTFALSDSSKEDSIDTACCIAFGEYVRWFYKDKIPTTLKDNLLPKPTPSIF